MGHQMVRRRHKQDRFRIAFASHSVAASTAGAVLRAAGSMMMAAGAMPIAASWSRTMKRKSAEVTITGGANPAPERRRAVA